MKKLFLFTFIFFITLQVKGSQILITMDENQTKHLKSYGIAFWLLENEVVIEWLLNYRGGSFLIPHLISAEEELTIRGVKYEVITDGQANRIK